MLVFQKTFINYKIFPFCPKKKSRFLVKNQVKVLFLVFNLLFLNPWVLAQKWDTDNCYCVKIESLFSGTKIKNLEADVMFEC